MFSSSDDEPLGLVLGLLAAILALVIALVIGLAASRSLMSPVAGAPAGAKPVPVAAAPVPVAPASAPVAAPEVAPALSAQAISDAASVTVEYGVVKFYFASGKADLAPGASEALVDVVRGARTGQKVVISGFHDATGNAAFNAGLARQRALAVKDALKASGVADSQIVLREPADAAGSGSDAEARRVEIVLQ